MRQNSLLKAKMTIKSELKLILRHMNRRFKLNSIRHVKSLIQWIPNNNGKSMNGIIYNLNKRKNS